MSLNPEAFRLYHLRLTAMTAALDNLPKPVFHGRACALGTLTSMLRGVNKLAEAWETRAMTAVDRDDVVRNGLTLRFLREDEWVFQDFEGVHFDLPETDGGLSYVEAVAEVAAAQHLAVG